MTAMSPAMDSALAGFTATVFGAVEIVLPDATIRLLFGSGIVVFDGKTFTGADPTYGVIESIENLTDGSSDQAPSLILTLIPADDAAAADLASAGMQGSQVTLWLGVVDPGSGLVIGEPLVLFFGMLDVATLKTGANSRTLDLDLISAVDYFFYNDDGNRLSDTFHQYLWPGETALSTVTGIEHQIYWGTAPVSGVTR